MFGAAGYDAGGGAESRKPLTHRLLDGPIVFADVVHDPRDAERPNEAQQVSQDPEHDAEDERPAEGLPQGLPDPLWTRGGCTQRPLGGGQKKRRISEHLAHRSEMFRDVWLHLIYKASSTTSPKCCTHEKHSTLFNHKRYKRPRLGFCGQASLHH